MPVSFLQLIWQFIDHRAGNFMIIIVFKFNQDPVFITITQPFRTISCSLNSISITVQQIKIHQNTDRCKHQDNNSKRKKNRNDVADHKQYSRSENGIKNRSV